MANCPQCGAPIQTGTSACKYCGEPITQATPQQPAYQQTANQQTANQQTANQQTANQQTAYQQSIYQQQGYQQPVYQQPQAGYQQATYQQPLDPGINPAWPIKNKAVAVILAIFLGGLGIHKFYLGKTGAGILYLIFCWTYIPSVIGFIEGILYAVSNDHNFQVKHKVRLK